MKRKIIHLSYLVKKLFYKDLIRSNQYYKRLYFSNSFIINLYIYRRFYYALNLVNLDDGRTFLDLGCGIGALFPTLNWYKKRTIGMDLDLEILLTAKDNISFDKFPLKNILLLNADGQLLPFRNKTIDAVFCLGTLEHAPNVKKLINEIYRILKDDGELIYSIPIEIGFSLIIRQVICKILKYPRDSYTFKELFYNGFLKKPPQKIHDLITHKNFDWRKIPPLINSKFKQISKIYSPFRFLKSISPTIVFKVIKRS